jgi:hypothetical protein
VLLNTLLPGLATESTDISEFVDVSVMSFNGLFAHAALPLAIDSYQRPYVWGPDKSAQLLTDLADYAAKDTSGLDYYMGTILLHRTKEHLFVIDGQQRLTTLCLLHQVIKSSLPQKCALSYRSPESWRNIKGAAALLSDGNTKLPAPGIFDHISFTVITVDSEDLAFTFFDTQNNRSVPLNATDLLKAYHLRAIHGQDGASLALQQNCATRWERLQGTPPLLGPGSDFAHSLFNLFLWRGRCWTGRFFGARPSHDELISEFQLGSFVSPSLDTIPLYSSRGNRRASALTLVPHDGYRLQAEEIHLSGNPAELPFAIRQPVTAGVGFFLYSEKYAALAHQLIATNHEDSEVRAFQRFHRDVIADVSIYIRELFLLASVMFVDQFGYRKLFEFALWLDYALGALRIEKAYIFKEAPLNFLKQPSRNLLDVITSAFRPEEAIDYLKSLPDPPKIYGSMNIERDGVQRRYEQSVLNYYRKSETLTKPRLAGRDSWIDAGWISANLKSEGLS